jgi:hypothetical protein
MTIPTEQIGSIPRPLESLNAISRHGSSDPSLESLYDGAVRDTIEQFEATGSPGEKAFAKIRSRVEGTALAEEIIHGR